MQFKIKFGKMQTVAGSGIELEEYINSLTRQGVSAKDITITALPVSTVQQNPHCNSSGARARRMAEIDEKLGLTGQEATGILEEAGD